MVANNIFVVEFHGDAWQDYANHVVGVFLDFDLAYTAGLVAWQEEGGDERTSWAVDEYAPNSTVRLAQHIWHIQDGGRIVHLKWHNTVHDWVVVE